MRKKGKFKLLKVLCFPNSCISSFWQTEPHQLFPITWLTLQVFLVLLQQPVENSKTLQNGAFNLLDICQMTQHQTKHYVTFYFNIKYINKASAGGIRSMCTYSYTHIQDIYACRTQTHYQAYNSAHKIKSNKRRCSHLKHVLLGPMPVYKTGNTITKQCSSSAQSVLSQVIWVQLNQWLMYICKYMSLKWCNRSPIKSHMRSFFSKNTTL